MDIQHEHINQLIKRCLQKDSTAQMEVYNLYSKAMYNSSLRILKDEFEAEDIMQEAFLTAFTKINSFKGEVAFGAWLKKIVINKSLSQLKKNKRYHAVKMEVIPNYNVEEPELKHSDLTSTTVLQSLSMLKENYRVVLTLNLIEGYDYEEISEILNYTNENVRTTISRAKKKLKLLILNKSKLETRYGQ